MDAEQLPLLPIEDIDRGACLTIDDRFAAFHERNPHILDALYRLARSVQDRGRRVGIKALWEQLRWQYIMRTDDEPYRLNNDYTSRYARLLMQSHPELDGLFETRALRSRGRRR